MMKTIYRRCIVPFVLGVVLVVAAHQAGAAETSEAPIPFKRVSQAEESGIARIVIGFGIAILALGVSLHFLRKRLGSQIGETSDGKQLHVIETRRLTPRSTLFVVEFAGARYLIAESGQGVTCMGAAASLPASNAGQSQ
ncbi:MAG TPA: flagellar biosynthetic protein FliO [Noviherbaspirillum sp.]|nr:flagellar biosynthetic protein FliO [Noviherbaspirillum sp.]